MLKIRKLNYRPWPVTVTLVECDETTGEVTEVKHTFVGHFRPFDEAELLAHRRECFGDEDGDENKKRLGGLSVVEYNALEAQFFARLMCGWGGVADEDEASLPYSEQALAALVCGRDGAAVRRALNVAVNELRFGLAPRKNAVPSPAPGPQPGEGAQATSSTTT